MWKSDSMDQTEYEQNGTWKKYFKKKKLSVVQQLYYKQEGYTAWCLSNPKHLCRQLFGPDTGPVEFSSYLMSLECVGKLRHELFEDTNRMLKKIGQRSVFILLAWNTKQTSRLFRVHGTSQKF